MQTYEEKALVPTEKVLPVQCPAPRGALGAKPASGPWDAAQFLSQNGGNPSVLWGIFFNLQVCTFCGLLWGYRPVNGRAVTANRNPKTTKH